MFPSSGYGGDGGDGATPPGAGPVLGIDLGTTNTVAAAYLAGQAYIIVDTQGNPLHPSVVAFAPNNQLLVSYPARDRRVIDPPNTIYSAKRIIGQPFRSPRVMMALQHLPYQVVEGANQEPMVVTRAGQYSVPQISSFVLGYVRQMAEYQLQQAVTRCVVTVPANFTETQRQATRLAAEMAGFEVLRVLNEPTAAALAYGQGDPRQQRIAIYDFGGGTFDLTVLALRDGLYEVIATGGEPFLGGDDMDRVLADRLALDFLQQHRVDLRTDVASMTQLMLAAEMIKQRLSVEDHVTDQIPAVAYGEGGRPLNLEFALTRLQFENLIEPIVDRSITVADQVLAEAGLSGSRVDDFILVGGTTRVPLVQRRVHEHFGASVRANIDPMMVVATGAAVQADNLASSAGRAPHGLLLDVTSHALGIATAGGFTEQLIAKNTTIPAEGTRVFATAKHGQTMVRIRVCQGPSRRFEENVQVGELVLDQLRPAPRGDVKVEVSFLIDANGLLSVAAEDLETGRETRAMLNLLGVSVSSRV